MGNMSSIHQGWPKRFGVGKEQPDKKYIKELITVMIAAIAVIILIIIIFNNIWTNST